MTIVNTKTGKARAIAAGETVKVSKHELAYDPARQIYDPIEKRVVEKVKSTRQEFAELRAELAELRKEMDQRFAALEAAKT